MADTFKFTIPLLIPKIKGKFTWYAIEGKEDYNFFNQSIKVNYLESIREEEDRYSNPFNYYRNIKNTDNS